MSINSTPTEKGEESINDHERPAECECQDEIGQRSCGPCYRRGFDIAASKEDQR